MTLTTACANIGAQKSQSQLLTSSLTAPNKGGATAPPFCVWTCLTALGKKRPGRAIVGSANRNRTSKETVSGRLSDG